jgi:hypothetical protein
MSNCGLSRLQENFNNRLTLSKYHLTIVARLVILDHNSEKI